MFRVTVVKLAVTLQFDIVKVDVVTFEPNEKTVTGVPFTKDTFIIIDTLFKLKIELTIKFPNKDD